MLAPLVLAALAVTALWLLVPAFERSFIYYPSRVPRDFPVPTLAHADLSEFDIVPEGGPRLGVWWAATRSERIGVLYYLHGNGGSLYDRVHLVDSLAARGLDVLMIDYRGYGKSDGVPSERGLYADAEAGLQWLTSERGLPVGQIVLLGKSLGSAVAIELATRHQFAALIVESGFTSVRDMGRIATPFVPGPLYGIMSHRFDSIGKIAQVQSPVLVVHGTQDDLVPVEMGRRLYEAAPEPKRWAAVEGGGHDDLALAEGGAAYDRIAAFVREALAAPR
jgi:fermentation-respiration switch protein FrsA (DUF1100 family)